MKRYIVAEGSFIGAQLVAPGSIVNEADLNGSKPGQFLIEVDENGRAVNAKDEGLVLRLLSGASAIAIAPIAPRSPGSTKPQALPGQPAGGVQFAGNDLPYVGAGDPREPPADRVARLRAELAAAEAALPPGSAEPLQPEPPLRRGEEQQGGGEPGPLDGSIPTLEEHLAGLTDIEEIRSLHKAETEGKGRVGALAAIDARLDELSQ